MAIDEAELMADTKITNIWANVSGAHLIVLIHLAWFLLKIKKYQEDINNVIETASAIQYRVISKFFILPNKSL